jgi:hypothetical protein
MFVWPKSSSVREETDARRIRAGAGAVSQALAIAAALCFLTHARAFAEDYPARPIRVIATSSAGGTSDIFMRALGEVLQKRLGQPIVIENRRAARSTLVRALARRHRPMGIRFASFQVNRWCSTNFYSKS